MIQVALITQNGNNVGVVGSDTSTGRVVYRFKPVGDVVGNVIDFWTGRSIVSDSLEEEGEKGSFVIRTRVTPSEKEYLPELLARAVNPPFGVRYIEEMGKSADLSNMILSEFDELV